MKKLLFGIIASALFLSPSLSVAAGQGEACREAMVVFSEMAGVMVAGKCLGYQATDLAGKTRAIYAAAGAKAGTLSYDEMMAEIQGALSQGFDDICAEAQKMDFTAIDQASRDTVRFTSVANIIKDQVYEIVAADCPSY